MSLLGPGSTASIKSKTSSSQSGAEDPKIWNCVNCRRRKVRCDRRQPCIPCTKSNVECLFPVSGRIPRRSRDAHHKKQTELVGRLRRLEAMVGDLSSQVERSTGAGEDAFDGLDFDSGNGPTAKSGTFNDINMSNDADPHYESSRDDIFAPEDVRNGHGIATEAQTIQGPGNVAELDITSNGDVVVGSRFWTVFCKEVEDIFEAVQGSTVISFDEDTKATKDAVADGRKHSGYHEFLVRSAHAAHQRQHLQPPEQMLHLWQVYMENVDPFIKILHTETMTKSVWEAGSSYNTVKTSMRALLHVVCLAAIMSLTDGEVKTTFAMDKDQLLARYRADAEAALQQTDFLSRIDMTSLQALTIYLTVLQNTGEAHSVWFLNGTLMRLAESFNLPHEGPERVHVSYSEIEMRRRLWWQIRLIDSRSQPRSESLSQLSQEMLDIEMPINRDDGDLDSLPRDLPLAKHEWTDSTVFLLRCEVWKLSQKLQSINQSNNVSQVALTQSIAMFQLWREKIRKSYLQHLDSTEALHAFTCTSTNLFIAKVDFTLYSKLLTSHTSNLPLTSHSDTLFQASLAIIIHTHALQHCAEWIPYRWQFSSRQSVPLHALRFVLAHLSKTDEWTSTCEDAWSAADRSIDDGTDQLSQGQCQDLLSLRDIVKKRRATGLRHQASFEEAKPAAVELPSASATNHNHVFSDPSEGNGPWSVNAEIKVYSREDPTLSVDFRSWCEHDLGSASFDMWDLSGF